MTLDFPIAVPLGHTTCFEFSAIRNQVGLPLTTSPVIQFK